METAINLEKRIGDHINSGNTTEEIESPSRRGFLKGLLSAGVAAYTPLAFSQDREQLISDEARNRIWANYPEMQHVIDLINEDENLRGTGRTMRNWIDFVLYPDQGISNRENIAITTKKIPIEDMSTPHYWLLLRIDSPGTRTYNLLFDRGQEYWGVPPLSPETGVWYFARGLKSRSSTNESDLLKALYIGATGSPDGAEPIINGTFAQVPGVRERAEEWRRSSPNPNALSDEGANHFAYLLMTLVDTNEEFIDRELVDLSLGILPEFYADTIGPNSEKGLIYMSGIAFRLTREDRLARYHTLNENIIDFPLNPRFR